MHQHDRGTYDRALNGARIAAYPSGEFVGQESFMTAGEILSLATQARIGPGVSVLDLCCGVAGPGRFITQELGCEYVGVDASAEAIEIARERGRDLGCRFVVSTIPPVPPGPFDAVLLLETMLAFRDKPALLRDVADALPLGGRFGFTFEEGIPLTVAERTRMPDADTVWLLPLPEMVALLGRVGLDVRWQQECSESHTATARCLIDAFRADASAIASQIGDGALADLVSAHELWVEWLGAGRVRKIALVAQKQGPS
jgi:SAM-dependent methyltransferase